MRSRLRRGGRALLMDAEELSHKEIGETCRREVERMTAKGDDR